jgi:actin-like ATPase involved in cell morphogenesis
MGERIAMDTNVPVILSNDALEAVVLGAGHCIENFSELRSLFMDSRRDRSE